MPWGKKHSFVHYLLRACYVPRTSPNSWSTISEQVKFLVLMKLRLGSQMLEERVSRCCKEKRMGALSSRGSPLEEMGLSRPWWDLDRWVPGCRAIGSRQGEGVVLDLGHQPGWSRPAWYQGTEHVRTSLPIGSIFLLSELGYTVSTRTTQWT